jgi:hypothetical protein
LLPGAGRMDYKPARAVLSSSGPANAEFLPEAEWRACQH